MTALMGGDSEMEGVKNNSLTYLKSERGRKEFYENKIEMSVI